MINVAVNGIGTIGKRVAEAVKKQDDMKLYGLSDVSAGQGLRSGLSERGDLHGTSLYASNEEGLKQLQDDGMDVEGLFEEEMNDIDIVVDCTPSGIDKKNKKNLYEPNNTKAIFQGGAPDDIADVKFNAAANYEDASGEDFVKVVSCNTTSLSRTLKAIDFNFGIDEVTANLVRRAGDIPQDSRGPVNSTVPVTDVPSHHGPDVQAVMPELDINTLAVKVPVTYGHVHMVTVDLEEDTSEEDVLDVFRNQSRINLESAEEGFDSTAKIHERMRDIGRKRSDMPETAIWRETITVDDGALFWIHMVHQESIVVPDSIDAIRSMFELEGKKVSIDRTNQNMDIG